MRNSSVGNIYIDLWLLPLRIDGATMGQMG